MAPVRPTCRRIDSHMAALTSLAAWTAPTAAAVPVALVASLIPWLMAKTATTAGAGRGRRSTCAWCASCGCASERHAMGACCGSFKHLRVEFQSVAFRVEAYSRVYPSRFARFRARPQNGVSALQYPTSEWHEITKYIFHCHSTPRCKILAHGKTVFFLCRSGISCDSSPNFPA